MITVFCRKPRQPAPDVGGDVDDVRPGSAIMLATVFAMFFHSALFHLNIYTGRLVPSVSPDLESLLRFIFMGASSIVFYSGVYFVLRERFWGLPLRVLLTNLFVLLQIGLLKLGHFNSELMLGVVLNYIALMFYVSFLQ